MTIELSSSDVYTTGIRSIDDQHVQFVRLIQRVQSSPSADGNDDTTADLLRELMAYAAYHFLSEENLMRQSGYPDLHAHAAEHGQLVSDLTQRVSDVMSGSSTKGKLLMFLWKWLVNHINLADREMALHLRALGLE